VLETMLPEVRRQTAGLRSEIVRGRQLQDGARNAAAQLRASEQSLRQRREQLAAMESRQRIASRAAAGSASREGDRALALAEDTRDLGSLMAQLRQDGALRARLAELPGPVPRPRDPAAAPPLMQEVIPMASPTGGFSWILPVTGRVVTGFAEPGATGASRGLTFAPPAAAQVVAPASGRIAFAGPYRGYGRIVIIEHDGGWSSLVTGLGTLNVAVGDRVVQGSPIGNAGPSRPIVNVELRKDAEPVNPLAYVRN